MARRLAFLMAAAIAFAVAPLAAARLGPIAGPALGLAVAIALALAASGVPSALTIAGGAIGAFVNAALSGLSPATGGAALCALAFAERTTRVRGRSARVVHVAAALVAGALASSLTFAFAGEPLAIRAIALMMAAVLAALPLLIEADDPLAHALETAAEYVSEPAKTELRHGSELRRSASDDLLDAKTAREIRHTWRSLLRLAETRTRLQRTRSARPTASPADAIVARLDQRITDHVVALTRAYVAVDATRAAEVSLDDTALRNLENVGESLEQVGKAIIDEV